MLPSFKDMKVPEQIIEALKNMGITKPKYGHYQTDAGTGTGNTCPLRRA